MNIAQFLEEISTRVGIEMTDEIQAVISNDNLGKVIAIGLFNSGCCSILAKNF